jgi:hypothetical protein
MSKGTRVSAPGNSTAGEDEAGARQALGLMIEALRLLDLDHGPHDVRAHLDLAINRLQASIDQGDATAD